MKIEIIIILLFLAVIIVGGCETETKEFENDDLVVLEGYIYQNEPVTHICLSKTLSFGSTDTVFKSIYDAEVFIGWNGDQYLLNPAGDGIYQYLSNDLQILEGNTYSITVNYNNKSIQAETTVPAKPTGVHLSATTISINESLTPWEMREQGLNEIQVTWENPENDYFYVVVENTEENPESIDFGFQLPTGLANFRFLSQPFKTDTYVLRIFLSIQQYGTHVVRVYRVNQEYADLYENREQDSRSLAEPLTNVHNGLGIFTAFSYEEAIFEVVKQ
jgi:hypothetical protein